MRVKCFNFQKNSHPRRGGSKARTTRSIDVISFPAGRREEGEAGNTSGNAASAREFGRAERSTEYRYRWRDAAEANALECHGESREGGRKRVVGRTKERGRKVEGCGSGGKKFSVAKRKTGGERSSASRRRRVIATAASLAAGRRPWNFHVNKISGRV